MTCGAFSMHEAMESIYHSVPIVALPVFIDLKVMLYLVMLLHPHPSSCLTKVGLRIMHSTYHFFMARILNGIWYCILYIRDG